VCPPGVCPPPLSELSLTPPPPSPALSPRVQQVCPPDFVLYFHCPAEVMVARLLHRGESSGRADDNEATIKKRLVVFETQSVPVVSHYARLGKLRAVSAVSGPDEVYAETRAAFQPAVTLVLGAPGAGKSELCGRLAAEFGHVHLSLPALQRAALSRRSHLGEQLDECISAGKMIPTELKLALLREAMRCHSRVGRFLVDDFPSAPDELAAFTAAVGAPELVLLLDAPPAACRARLLTPKGNPRRPDGDDADTVASRQAAHAELTAPWAASLTTGAPALGGARVVTLDAARPAAAVADDARSLLQRRIFLLAGKTGVGRGSVCARLGHRLRYARIRVTLLQEEEVAAGTERGKRIAAAVKAGRAAALADTLFLIKRAMARVRPAAFVLDGFPRLVADGFPSIHDQVAAAERELGPISGLVCLDASDEACGRRVKEGDRDYLDSGLTYRLEKLPVVRFYEALGRAVTVDAEQAEEGVYAAVVGAFEQLAAAQDSSELPVGKYRPSR
jgi:adenylate kinase family enzyme